MPRHYEPLASGVAAVGALDPASKGKSEADQDKNRRVVIVLIP
jgi:outer membrane protein OmpA-like peptidoglycan-associated protein